MNVLKINKKDIEMNTLIIETNQYLKDSSLRKQNGLNAALASCKLEGVSISKELADEISIKVEDDVRKFLG